MNEAWLAFNGLALTRELVEWHTIFLDGADHRRRLIKIAMVFGERRIQLIAGKIGDRPGFDDLSVGVLAVRDLTEAQRADILLVLAHEEVLDFCSSADGDDQETCRERVERAAVADFFGVQRTAGYRHDIVGCHAGGFVYEQDAINFSSGFHQRELLKNRF